MWIEVAASALGQELQDFATGNAASGATASGGTALNRWTFVTSIGGGCLWKSLLNICGCFCSCHNHTALWIHQLARWAIHGSRLSSSFEHLAFTAHLHMTAALQACSIQTTFCQSVLKLFCLSPQSLLYGRLKSVPSGSRMAICIKPGPDAQIKWRQLFIRLASVLRVFCRY